MTGLMLKDLLILRKNMRTYLLFIVLYGGLAATGAWSPEFVGGFIMVLTAMLPMNVFAYDKQAKWDTYSLALPVGRTKTVCARYGVVVLLCLFSVILEAAIGMAMLAIGKLEEPSSYLATCAVCGLTSMLINAVLLPVLYKFGPEQARVALFILMGLIVLLGWLFLIPLGGVEWLESLGKPTPAQIAALPFIAAIAGVVLLTLSFLLSRHFYGQRDV